MPLARMLIDLTTNHIVISLMHANASCNQVYIAKEYNPKIAFRCLWATETFEWVMMPFGLKNASVTYHNAMNAIFHDIIGKSMRHILMMW